MVFIFLNSFPKNTTTTTKRKPNIHRIKFHTNKGTPTHKNSPHRIQSFILFKKIIALKKTIQNTNKTPTDQKNMGIISSCQKTPIVIPMMTSLTPQQIAIIQSTWAIPSKNPLDAGEAILMAFFEKFPKNIEKFEAFKNTPLLSLKVRILEHKFVYSARVDAKPTKRLFGNNFVFTIVILENLN